MKMNEVFNRKKRLLCDELDLELRKRLVKFYMRAVLLYGTKLKFSKCGFVEADGENKIGRKRWEVKTLKKIK